jgi:hypothetical protein
MDGEVAMMCLLSDAMIAQLRLSLSSKAMPYRGADLFS